MTRALLAAVALALAACRTCPEPRPAPPAPCLVKPPPAPVRGIVRVTEGCPEGAICVRREDAQRQADEVRDRRAWDALAWEACRAPP